MFEPGRNFSTPQVHVALDVEYIDDMKTQSSESEDVYIQQNDNEILFVFIVFLMELLSSIYFFFIINGFIAIKWPK